MMKCHALQQNVTPLHTSGLLAEHTCFLRNTEPWLDTCLVRGFQDLSFHKLNTANICSLSASFSSFISQIISTCMHIFHAIGFGHFLSAVFLIPLLKDICWKGIIFLSEARLDAKGTSTRTTALLSLQHASVRKSGETYSLAISWKQFICLAMLRKWNLCDLHIGTKWIELLKGLGME